MDLTIAILSWNAHRTLKNTLEGYKAFGLDRLPQQKIIFFQEISAEDLRIAEHYGYVPMGDKENIGIGPAYARLVAAATQPNFLFLENDWVLLDYPFGQLVDGIDLLESGAADVVRYRHRRFPGDPLWTRQFQGSEYDRPTHLLDCVHWVDFPEKFPEITAELIEGVPWYFASSRNANWTNNPTMFRTSFLENVIVPRMGNRDVEVDIQEWWEQQDYTVAQSNGLFTHRRIG